MGKLRFLCLTALLSFWCGHADAQRVYRDPGGRYSFPVPQGWTATPNGPALMLVSGDSYGLVMVIEGGAADPSRVAQYTDQFGRQWQAYQRLQNGNATLGGVRALMRFTQARIPRAPMPS